jgi:Xaa-Pro aminopeptidase
LRIPLCVLYLSLALFSASLHSSLPPTLAHQHTHTHTHIHIYMGNTRTHHHPLLPPTCSYLRLNRVLKEGMVVTIEPGCYFVNSALEPALADPTLSKFFVLKKLAKFRDFGGVRIEDDILITADGSESLSDAVKEIADIQAIQQRS